MTSSSHIESFNDTEWLEDLLKEVQLEQFLERIRDDLQVTRLAHLIMCRARTWNVVVWGSQPYGDLWKRYARKSSTMAQKYSIEKLIGGGKQPSSKKSSNATNKDKQQNTQLTCLIHEKDITLGSKLGDGSSV
ncbi:Activated CDC42 kinase 1 [Eumeta japonica]|uniref:non-specific protein-tyrosine kinase n=1 Tax=Eumeta variegata TaxID=151549 RepID=A0A4C1TKI0_EUMVA|nr:Activated CDC42 kinase 1 [Eumeta japonica]